MRVREDYRTLTGPEKAAILMLSIGEEHAAKLFALMDDEEIKELSQTMSNLGTVHSSIIERLFVEFADQISSTGSLVGESGVSIGRYSWRLPMRARTTCPSLRSSTGINSIAATAP